MASKIKASPSRPKRGRPRMPTDDRRDQLLEASLKVFLKKGFHATRIEDIVAAAGTGKGTFYLSFADKEEAFSALLDPFFADVNQALIGVFENLDAKQSLTDLFDRETQHIFSAFVKWKPVATLLLREAGSAGPRIERKVSEFYRGLVKTSRETFEFAIGIGLLPRFNAEIAAVCIVGAIEKVYSQWLKGDLKAGQAEAVLETSRFLQRGCGLSAKSQP